MKVYALIWGSRLLRSHLIGVFSTREAAKAADPENEYYIHELDLDKVYDFQRITADGDTCLG